MPFAQHGLDVLCDIGIIQRIVDVVAGAGAAVGQGDVEVDLYRLRYDLFTLIDSNERGDFEFSEIDDVHSLRLVAN